MTGVDTLIILRFVWFKLVIKLTMTKFKKLSKTDFEFYENDVSSEFKETIDHVFVSKNTLFFVFKKDITTKTIKNVKSHVRNYYKSKGWLKIKFLKQ